MNIKALIVDDERLARKELHTLLKSHAGIDVVGEAASTAEAVECVERLIPDVVFLDIHMPGESGFELLHRISKQPQFIFVTAYDAHAVRAFDVEAIDYLLKPVRPDRLARAIARLSAGNGGKGNTIASQKERVYLSDRGHIYLIALQEIVHIGGAIDYSEVVTDTRGAILDGRTLSVWESILPADRFIRIHRSTIVNMDWVKHMVRGSNNSCTVYLKDETMAPLKMSRRYAARLKDRFRFTTLS